MLRKFYSFFPKSSICSYYSKSLKERLQHSVTEADKFQFHKLTPVMQQYFRIKNDHKNYLLLFRMGDFYEIFFDDAVKAAHLLDISLTTRGKIQVKVPKNENSKEFEVQEKPIPMCGIPFHALETYLQRLVKKGVTVAICEQSESVDSEKRKILDREISRLVTPGTLLEESYLDARENNFLAAIYLTSSHESSVGLAFVDISTGLCQTLQVSMEQVQTELLKMNPKEILLPKKLVESNHQVVQLCEQLKLFTTTQEDKNFNSEKANWLLEEAFPKDIQLTSYSLNELNALCGILFYILETQKGSIPMLDKPIILDQSKAMKIDTVTRRSLELTKTFAGEKSGSFLDFLDNTVSAGGSRLLHYMLNNVLTDVTEMNKRYDTIEYFVHDLELIEQTRALLKTVSDVERCIQRIAFEKGGPRDLLAICQTIETSKQILHILKAKHQQPTLILDCIKAIESMDLWSVIERIRSAIIEEPPVSWKEGGFIAPLYSAELDQLRNLEKNHTSLIEELQEKYKQITGVSTLKIKNNNISGYFVEVPLSWKQKMDSHSKLFSPIQSLVNNIRYKTSELAALQTKIESAKSDAIELESKLFHELRNTITNYSAKLKDISKALSQLDLYSSFALMARINKYVRPIMHPMDPKQQPIFLIKDGRHPVVENSLFKNSGTTFVSNNCSMTEKHSLLLIGGINMSGKSCYLRQNALIVLMAQMGCFVPASHAEMTCADQLHSRVGSADNLANNQSTFLVEMLETSKILNNATRYSFVILDEIGRGTASHDGISIATSVLEFLHTLRCRTLFSTHYHELVPLTHHLPHIGFYHMSVLHKGIEEIIFTHKVQPGSIDKSFGIYVAKMAGLPNSVIERAYEILHQLEKRK